MCNILSCFATKMELIMLNRDILPTSNEFFSVHAIGTVINFVCSF